MLTPIVKHRKTNILKPLVFYELHTLHQVINKNYSFLCNRIRSWNTQ